MDDKLRMYDAEIPNFKALEQTPFSITFSWEGETITIELKQGKDVLKVASVFSLMLTENGIEHNIKRQKNA